MRVVITIGPKDPHGDWMRDEAEWCLRHHARDRRRVREDADRDGRVVPTFEFSGPLDAIGFHTRAETAERRGRLD